MKKYAQITSSDGQYYGFDATLNLWNPNVTFSGEYSTSQVWISSLGPPDKASTLVAGWQVRFKLAKNKLQIYVNSQ